jgi:hypothetical protein
VGYASAQVAFVDDRSCARCHESQYREWTGSHHDLAMQPADEKTVLGDFNDAKITHFGVTSRFWKRGASSSSRPRAPMANRPTSRSNTRSASIHCSST